MKSEMRDPATFQVLLEAKIAPDWIMRFSRRSESKK
jgi:hypothetical protein